MQALEANAEQIAQFQKDGFTVFPYFFAANELAALRAELERFKREGLGRNVATDECDVCEGDGVDFGLERYAPVRSAVRENALWSIVILCSHGAEILGSALEPTVAALKEVIRSDKNIIAVGFAMDALARLANLRPADDKPLPLIVDLQKNLRDMLAEAPVQCWESLVREGVMP